MANAATRTLDKGSSKIRRKTRVVRPWPTTTYLQDPGHPLLDRTPQGRNSVPKATAPPRFAATVLPEGYWQNAQNRRKYLDYLAFHLRDQQKTPYEASYGLVVASGGRGLINHYEGSVSSAHVHNFPETSWQMWRFESSPKKWWADLADQFAAQDPIALAVLRDYVEDMSGGDVNRLIQGGIEALMRRKTELYRLSHIRDLGTLLSVLYNLQVSNDWPKDFTGSAKRARPRDWALSNVRRGFLETFINTGNPTELYELTSSQLIAKQAMALLSLYQNSIAAMVSTEFPEYSWDPWKFTSLHFWRKAGRLFRRGDPLAQALVESFLQSLAQSRQSTLSEWKNRLPQLTSGEAYRVSFLGTSLGQVLATLRGVPSSDTRESQVRGRGFGNVSERRAFVAELARTKFQKSDPLPKDFYGLNFLDFVASGGGDLLRRHKNSTALAVMALFPEHEWRPWRFEKTPKMWWEELYSQFYAKDAEAVRLVGLFLLELAQTQGITSWLGWGSLALDLLNATTYARLRRLGGVYEAIDAVTRGFSDPQAFDSAFARVPLDERELFRALFTAPVSGVSASSLRSQKSQQLISEKIVASSVGDLLPRQNGPD